MFNKTDSTITPSTQPKIQGNHKVNKMIITAQAFSQLNGTDVEKIFQPMSAKPWAMWLDSGSSEHVDSRFDILVWSPIASLITRKDITEVNIFEVAKNFVGSKHYQSTDDPLTLVKSLQTQLFDQSVTHEFLPFLGGALGYFSYDLGRRFEQLPTLAKQDINLPEMAIGLYSQAIIFDKTTAIYYLICPDYQREEIESTILKRLKATEKCNKTANIKSANLALNNNKTAAQQPFSLTTDWSANMDKSSYINKFNAVQAYLLSGDCYQVNLAQRFQASYQGNEFEAYLALKVANKAPFSAFIRLDNSAILSISPERFLQLSQGKVQSKPIKGTMPRSSDVTQDIKNAEILKHSSKDKAENLMIVDLLRNDISRSCQAGTVKVPKLFDIESFPAVHHLVSTVEGELSQHKHATDLLRGAFPGGSITGAPKIRAMEVIEELEPHQRSIYCGSIGYISNCGTMDTSITIRTLVCQSNADNTENTIFCWAGGGIVADSKADSEYQETFDKVNCILPVLSQLNKH